MMPLLQMDSLTTQHFPKKSCEVDMMSLPVFSKMNGGGPIWTAGWIQGLVCGHGVKPN